MEPLSEFGVVRRAVLAALVALVVAGCGTQQRAPGGGDQSVLPSPQLQSESAPPGDLPAPATQPAGSP